MHLRVVNYAALLQLFYMLFRYTVYGVIIFYNGKHKTFPQWMDNNYWRIRFMLAKSFGLGSAIKLNKLITNKQDN